jgi:hypothetical protein
MIDLKTEQLLSLCEAARRLPPGRRGRPVHFSCVLRWIMDGVRTPHGKVQLEAIRMGGRWITSVEALERFAAAQTPDLTERPQLPRTPAARRRASERAAAELERFGI